MAYYRRRYRRRFRRRRRRRRRRARGFGPSLYRRRVGRRM